MVPNPPFVELVLRFLKITVVHGLVMFPYITLPPFIISPLLQVFGRDTARARLLRHPRGGFRHALWLGLCSPPGRSKVFAEARRLFAAGVSPADVMTYLVAAHLLVVYVPLLILALNGPQPIIGLVLAALLSMGVMRMLLRRIPETAWDGARTALADVPAEAASETPPSRTRAAFRALRGDLGSLWWPLLFGVVLAATVAAWGLGPTFFALPGGEGVLGQGLSAAIGLLLSYVTGVPAVGNVYPAAFLWKAEFFTYAGLITFYLGVLVTPFALPRYTELFGRELGWVVIRRFIVAALLSALAVTAFWYGLDGILHAVGLAEPIESLMGSTVEPSAVPWFHTLFQGHAH